MFQEIDSGIVSDGLAAQQSAALPQSAFLGSYAMNASGTAATAVQNLVGQLGVDANGNVTAGSVDISSFPGSLVSGQALTGTLTIASSGRGTLALHSGGVNRSFAVHAATPALVFMVEVDSGAVSAGSLGKQF